MNEKWVQSGPSSLATQGTLRRRDSLPHRQAYKGDQKAQPCGENTVLLLITLRMFIYYR